MSYPVQNLLRPPVELVSAGTFFVGSALLAATPDWLPLDQAPAWGMSFAVFAASIWRFRQGAEILRYQRNLRALKRYGLKPSEIPWSHEVLFLGMGFKWTALHTQRLHQALLPRNRRYVEARSPTLHGNRAPRSTGRNSGGFACTC